MNIVDAINLSSRAIYLILVPVLRELAGVLLAIAISKDCKARDNGSGALWGLFTLISPAFAGIIYCIYSRFLAKRNAKTNKDKKKIRTSRRLTVWAVLVYIIALVIAVIAIITSAASGIASSIKNDSTNINSIMYDEYYDMNGVKYDAGEQVILYDKEGNEYKAIGIYAFFDKNGKIVIHHNSSRTAVNEYAFK